MRRIRWSHLWRGVRVLLVAGPVVAFGLALPWLLPASADAEDIYTIGDFLPIRYDAHLDAPGGVGESVFPAVFNAQHVILRVRSTSSSLAGTARRIREQFRHLSPDAIREGIGPQWGVLAVRQPPLLFTYLLIRDVRQARTYALGLQVKNPRLDRPTDGDVDNPGEDIVALGRPPASVRHLSLRSGSFRMAIYRIGLSPAEVAQYYAAMLPERGFAWLSAMSLGGAPRPPGRGELLFCRRGREIAMIGFHPLHPGTTYATILYRER